MRLRLSALAIVAAFGLAIPAQATTTDYVMVFDILINGADPNHLIRPDRGQSPQTSGGILSYNRISDSGNGTPTLVNHVAHDGPILSVTDVGDFVGVPGATINTISDNTYRPAVNQTGAGDSTPVAGPGAIAWGPLTGWTRNGGRFCFTTGGSPGPGPVCPLANATEGGTTLVPLHSGSYDTGTWEFGHSGTFQSRKYFFAVFNGGTANAEYVFRGSPFGVAPVMPVAGLAALCASLLLMGQAALRRRNK